MTGKPGDLGSNEIALPGNESEDSPAEFYVLSQGERYRSPATGCLLEFDDVICGSCGAELITGPTSMRNGLLPNVVRKLRPIRTSVPAARTNKPQVLIVTGLTPNILGSLRNMPNWRSRFDVACAYIMDAAWPLGSEYADVLSQMDCLFIPMTNILDNYRSLKNVRVEMVAYACDTARFAPGEAIRSIDVIGYGRQFKEHSRIIEQTYNAPTSPRMYYHTNYFSKIEIDDHRAQRAVFWKILKRSRIAMAYDMLVAKTPNFSFSMVAQRWFECVTAGCAIVGKRPTCPEADTLLDWQDATIEVPDEADLLIPFLEDLLRDTDRLGAIHVRNRQQAMRRHDWRHRIDEMLRHLDIPSPTRLANEIEQLRDVGEEL